MAYEALYLLSPARRQLFFNGGYLPLAADLHSGEDFAREAHCAMMYHFVARTLPGEPATSPRSVLDVGCGQGGGLRYLAGLFPDAAITGTDRSMGAVMRARRNLRRMPRVQVVRTAAAGAGIVGRDHDLIVGVGTPTYVGLARFIAESRRHLAPGGIVSISGGYRQGDHAQIRAEIAEAAAAAGMALAEYRDVSANTFAALNADIPRRERAVARVPWPFRGLARRWSDLPGSREYREYEDGLRADFAAVLHWPADPSDPPPGGARKAASQ